MGHRGDRWDGPAADLNPEGERRLAAAVGHEFAFVTRGRTGVLRAGVAG